MFDPEKIYVTVANEFKDYLRFIDDDNLRKNISYHFQYIEFLYQIRRRHELEFTTLSLSNKTIILEFWSIIEAILFHFVSRIEKIPEKIPASALLVKTKEHSLVSDKICNEIDLLKNCRDHVHITKNEDVEFNAYYDEILVERQNEFKSFMEYIFKDKGVLDYTKFPWAWELYPYNSEENESDHKMQTFANDAYDDPIEYEDEYLTRCPFYHKLLFSGYCPICGHHSNPFKP